jgi:uncharacterized protein (TIGR02596 family)
MEPAALIQHQDRIPKQCRDVRGFTLVELLVVIMVIALLLAIGAPGLIGSVGAARITEAGDNLMIYVSEAQQRAMATGRPVEVRFYRVATEGDLISGATANPPFRGAMMLEYYNQGERDPRGDLDASKRGTLSAPLALARKGTLTLPNGVAMSADEKLSTLLNSQGESYLPKRDGEGSVETSMRSGSSYVPFKSWEGQEYFAFTFFPETTNLDTNSAKKWHVTVVSDSELQASASEVKNFYCISVDALTGRLTAYRP